MRGVTVTVDTMQRQFFLSGILRRRSTTSDAEKYSQSENFVSKQKDQHIMLQNILILNILSLCKKIRKMMLQNIQDFVHIHDGFGCVFVPDCIALYCGLSCDYYQPCDDYNCVGVRGFLFVNSLTAKPVLAGEKLIATYSISM